MGSAPSVLSGLPRPRISAHGAGATGAGAGAPGARTTDHGARIQRRTFWADVQAARPAGVYWIALEAKKQPRPKTLRAC